MTAIGYDPARDVLMISGVGTYQPLTLAAEVDDQGFLHVRTMAGRSELYQAWSEITDLADPPSGFSSPDALLTYLQGEFAKRRSVGETFDVATVAGADLVQGMPVAISRATGQLLPARADTYALAFVAGLASADTEQGFTDQPAHGAVTLSDWTAITGAALLAAGMPYFLAPGGGLSTASVGPGSTCVTRVGFAASATTLVVEPSPPILL
jgi:hypothetical protein